MRVLMVSWEYPPLIFGGLGRHVHGLAEALAVDGHDVTVLTQGLPAVPDDEVVNQVRIVRVRTDASTDDFAAWVRSLNAAQTHVGRDVVSGWRPDVVHARSPIARPAGSSSSSTLTWTTVPRPLANVAPS